MESNQSIKTLLSTFCIKSVHGTSTSRRDVFQNQNNNSLKKSVYLNRFKKFNLVTYFYMKKLEKFVMDKGKN